MKTDRRQLLDWEKEECAALKAELAAFNARSPKGKRLTQEEIAHALGMSQGTLSSHLNGHRALNKEMAAKIAKMLGVPVENFSIRLASDISSMAEAVQQPVVAVVGNDHRETKESAAAKVLEMLQKHGGGLSEATRQQIADAVAGSLAESEAPAAAQQSNVIIADFLRPAPAGDAIRIAHYDVRTALGSGQVVPDYPEMMADIVVSRLHLQELGVTYKDPAHLKMLTGHGQSMAPTIQHLDPMIVDASIREFEGDGIYSFVWQGHFYTKRLQVADVEHFEMISDNPNHKDRTIRIDETYIQARVLLVWNAKKL